MIVDHKVRVNFIGESIKWNWTKEYFPDANKFDRSNPFIILTN